MKGLGIKEMVMYGLAIYGGYNIYEKIKNKEKFFNQIGIGGSGPPNCWSDCPNPQGIFSQQGLCPNTHRHMFLPNCKEDVPGVTAAFQANIDFGMGQYGCNFLNNQFNQHNKKLQVAQPNLLNKLSLERLTNRRAYISELIKMNCGPGKKDVASRPLFDGSVHPNLPI